MNQDIKITKEKILEAASKCPQAKQTLETLFPEVFVDDKSIILLESNIIKNPSGHFNSKDLPGSLILIRNNGTYYNRAFWLSTSYNWNLIKDINYSSNLLLVPTKK